MRKVKKKKEFFRNSVFVTTTVPTGVFQKPLITFIYYFKYI